MQLQQIQTIAHIILILPTYQIENTELVLLIKVKITGIM
jgi:hypothetical protein